jgi:hypothetical protein
VGSSGIASFPSSPATTYSSSTFPFTSSPDFDLKIGNIEILFILDAFVK